MVISEGLKKGYQKRYMGGESEEMPSESSEGSGIPCEAINCTNNQDHKCGVEPSISAGGACMTYSKEPMEATPGEENPMPEGGMTKEK